MKLMNYEQPTPIQKHSIPISRDGRDVMCCAQTGSGKTMAFLLPAFAGHLKPRKSGHNAKTQAVEPCALVLAPTRELASQIFEEALKIANRSGATCACIYGGAKLRPQLLELADGADLLVATPGRLIDLIERG